jgi:hypothetical protein
MLVVVLAQQVSQTTSSKEQDVDLVPCLVQARQGA